MIVTPKNVGELSFDANGLLPAVAQNIDTGEVLMLAWMNREAVQCTLERQRAVFWSRSRGRLWEKGEQSGHTLDLAAVHADCDRDTLLLLVRPRGPACHEGTLTCFADYPLTDKQRADTERPDGSPSSHPLEFLAELERVIDRRLASGDAGSYTAKLAAAGIRRIAQKVGEEGLEVALAATGGTREEIVSESADLLFHLSVLLRSSQLSLQEVAAELQGRHSARG